MFSVTTLIRLPFLASSSLIWIAVALIPPLFPNSPPRSSQATEESFAISIPTLEPPKVDTGVAFAALIYLFIAAIDALFRITRESTFNKLRNGPHDNAAIDVLNTETALLQVKVLFVQFIYPKTKVPPICACLLVCIDDTHFLGHKLSKFVCPPPFHSYLRCSFLALQHRLSLCPPDGGSSCYDWMDFLDEFLSFPVLQDQFTRSCHSYCCSGGFSALRGTLEGSGSICAFIIAVSTGCHLEPRT